MISLERAQAVSLGVVMDKVNIKFCCWIWENPPYRDQHVFCILRVVVPQVKLCQSPDFVISMSNHRSSNCYHRLRRLVVSCKGKLSLLFDFT